MKIKRNIWFELALTLLIIFFAVLYFAGIYTSLICLNPIGLNLVCYNSLDDNNEIVEVMDRVTVDKSIIDGFEGEDYIPRSASINERLNI